MTANPYRELVDSTFRDLQIRGRGIEAPFLAVLGPLGSGRAELLDAVRSRLDGYGAAHVSVPLAGQPVFDEDQAHFAVLENLCDALGIKAGDRIVRSPKAARVDFEREIRGALATGTNPVVVYLERLERVPRFVVRSLGSTFRQILEKDDEYPQYHRIGFVWSGALSFFELKEEHDSAFSMCEPILLPVAGSSARRDLLDLQLESLSLELSPSAADVVVEETGAEPGFLGPVLDRVSTRTEWKGSEDEVREACRRLSRVDSKLESLAEVAIHLHQNSRLARTVEEMLGGADVRPREITGDIDSFVLSGALLIDQDRREPSYVFRNAMTRRFCENVLKRGRPLFARTASSNRKGLVGALENAEMGLARAANLRAALTELETAWPALTQQPPLNRLTATIGRTGATEIVQFDSMGRSIRRKVGSGETTTSLVPYVSIDDQNALARVVLAHEQALLAVEASVSREALRLPLTEFGVRPWTRLCRAFRTHLTNLALSAVGLDALAPAADDSLPATLPRTEARSTVPTLSEEQVAALSQALKFGLNFEALRSSLVAIQGDADALERLVRGTGFDDPSIWATRLVATASRMCRVSYKVKSGTAFGTGFLVAPDLVLTNYHVVEPLKNGEVEPTAMALTFGYAETDSGIDVGEKLRLAAKWHVASAPYGAADLHADGGVPAKGELDFAVLRVSGRLGETRGWIEIGEATPPEGGDGIIFVLQHPDGDPLRQSIGRLRRRHSPLRVRYDADTSWGSSGGLVLDHRLAPIALHHAGDPRTQLKAEYNQGIPLHLIREALSGMAGVDRFWCDSEESGE